MRGACGPAHSHHCLWRRLSQHLTSLCLEGLGPLVDAGHEAAVLPAVLLPLLALVELSHKHGWPPQVQA